jgi:hypothetical protein
MSLPIGAALALVDDIGGAQAATDSSPKASVNFNDGKDCGMWAVGKRVVTGG